MSDPQDNPDKRIKFHQHNQHFIFAFHFQALPEKSVSALTREGGGIPRPGKLWGYPLYPLRKCCSLVQHIWRRDSFKLL